MKRVLFSLAAVVLLVSVTLLTWTRSPRRPTAAPTLEAVEPGSSPSPETPRRQAEGGDTAARASIPQAPPRAVADTSLLLAPAPFDPSPIRAAEARDAPGVPGIAPVHETTAAIGYRRSAVAATSPDGRIEAIMKLAEVGGPSDVPALNELIASDPVLKVREAAHHAVLVIHSRFAGQPWK